MVGLSLGSLADTDHPVAAEVPTPTAQHKRVKPLQRTKYKRVCSVPSPNRPTCLAEVATDNASNPLAGPTPTAVSGYGPAEFHTAYNMPCRPGGVVQITCATPASYGPETIAIVVYGGYGGSGSIESNLADYNTYYGLPSCTIANGCLTILNENGQTSPLPASSGASWATEMNLDVQAAHMMCQTCKIILIEANSVWIGENTAASFNPIAISNSWGYTTAFPALDSYFVHPGIAVVFATGDSGSAESPANWPADLPSVVAASGTTLQLNVDNTWAQETVWSGSGGGCSLTYSAPSWQTNLANWATAGCGTKRAVGDLAADADPSTGMAVNNGGGTWIKVGGTSLSAPLIAGAYALAGGIGTGVTAPSSIYQNFNSYNSHDITVGNDCTVSVVTHCTAGAGFDTPSGMGSLIGISALTAQPLTAPTAFSIGAVTQNSVQLTWVSSSSSIGVTGYNIFRNGTKVGTTTGTSYTDTGLTPNTSYSYGISAYDNAIATPVNATALSTTTFYPSDVNGDLHINLLDLSMLAFKYGQTGASLGRADVNHDGVVDLLDLSILATNYGSE